MFFPYAENFKEITHMYFTLIFCLSLVSISTLIISWEFGGVIFLNYS